MVWLHASTLDIHWVRTECTLGSRWALAGCAPGAHWRSLSWQQWPSAAERYINCPGNTSQAGLLLDDIFEQVVLARVRRGCAVRPLVHTVLPADRDAAVQLSLAARLVLGTPLDEVLVFRNGHPFDRGGLLVGVVHQPLAQPDLGRVGRWTLGHAVTFVHGM